MGYVHASWIYPRGKHVRQHAEGNPSVMKARLVQSARYVKRVLRPKIKQPRLADWP